MFTLQLTPGEVSRATNNGKGPLVLSVMLPGGAIADVIGVKMAEQSRADNMTPKEKRDRKNLLQPESARDSTIEERIEISTRNFPLTTRRVPGKMTAPLVFENTCD